MPVRICCPVRGHLIITTPIRCSLHGPSRRVIAGGCEDCLTCARPYRHESAANLHTLFIGSEFSPPGTSWRALTLGQTFLCRRAPVCRDLLCRSLPRRRAFPGLGAGATW